MSSFRHWTAALFLPALLFAGCTPPPAGEPIVVGHLAPFSGPDRLVGEHARQGIILAVEEVNDSDEKVTGRRVEVHHADDRGSPAMAGDEAVRLVTITKAVALLGGTSTASAEQVARTAESLRHPSDDAHGIPFVTPSPLPRPLAGETAFSTDVPPAQQGKALALFATSELKAKHVAVLFDARNPVCTGVAEAFVREVGDADGRGADQYRYDGDAGLNDLAGRVQKAKADAVLIAAPPADFGKLRDGLAKAGVKAPLLFGGEESAWPTLLADPDAGLDVYAVTTFVTGGLPQRGQDFVKKYQERFREAPDLAAAAAYDGARLLFEAMRRAKSGKPERVRDALAGMDNFDSVTGPLSIDKDDHGARRPVFVVQRQEGRPKVVKRYDANLK